MSMHDHERILYEIHEKEQSSLVSMKGIQTNYLETIMPKVSRNLKREIIRRSLFDTSSAIHV